MKHITYSIIASYIVCFLAALSIHAEPLQSVRLDDTEVIARAWFSPDDSKLIIECGRIVRDEGSYQVHEPLLRVLDINTHNATPFTGHVKYGSGVHTIVFSPDGKKALSAGYSYKAILWDIETCETIHEFSFDDHIVPFPVSAVCYTGDGKYIVICAKNMVSVFDSISFELLNEFPCLFDVFSAESLYGNRFILHASPSKVMDINNKVYFDLPSVVTKESKDEKYIFCPGADENDDNREITFRKYDAETGEIIEESNAFTDPHDWSYLVMSSDGRYFFFKSESKLYRIDDAGDIQGSPTVLDTDKNPATLLAFTNDNKRIAAKKDDKILICDIESLFQQSYTTDLNK